LERTLVIVKPDGVQRGLTGEVITRLERRGLKIVALKMLSMPQDSGGASLCHPPGKTVLRGADPLHHV